MNPPDSNEHKIDPTQYKPAEAPTGVFGSTPTAVGPADPTPPAPSAWSNPYPPNPGATSFTPTQLQPTQPPVAAPHAPVNAGLVVLQWLTYAFWGWTVLALSFLTSLVVANFIASADIGSGAAYGIAAVIVLLPISYICDHFYSKREPQHKTGAETIVMVIHAVLFALFGIGSLVVSVFSVVSLLTTSTDSKATTVSLICGLIIAVYYGITFLRTLNPAGLSRITRHYKLFMLVTISIIAVLGIVGPVAKERSLRDDRLIVNELPNVNNAIKAYHSKNSKLPASLDDLDVDGDSKRLIDNNLATYKPGSAIKSTYNDNYPSSSYSSSSSIGGSVAADYSYELCVNYKEKSSDLYGSSSSKDTDAEGYTTYLSTYDHPAGKVCYKLRTSDY